MSTAEPRISLVMIAKDEQANLPRALESAARFVDEIILVDTGSTDRTVQIAESYGAKVHHHPWQGDFSLHRNQALSYAGGDWCLQLDADEALDPAGGPLLRELAAAPEVMAYWVTIENVFSTGERTSFRWPRFFRRHPQVRYTRRVHNVLEVPGPVQPSTLRILHYGYDGDQSQRQARRLAMIRQWVAQEPDNWEAHYYLAQTLVAQPETVEEAVREALGSLELARGAGVTDPRQLSRIYLPLAQGLNILERHHDSLEHCGAWAALVPIHPDPYLYLGRAQYALEMLEDACRSLEIFCRLHGRYRDTPAALHGFEVKTQGLIYSALVIWLVAEWRLGRRQRALNLLGACLEQPRAEEVCALAAEHAQEKGCPDLARELARIAAQRNPHWPWPQRFISSGGDTQQTLAG